MSVQLVRAPHRVNAPDFILPDAKKEQHQLADYAGQWLVLYFYPKDDTPGCTVEANNFEKNFSKFKKLSAAVVGISGGTNKTKEKFCTKHELESLILLSDTDFSVAKAYESYGEKKFMGRTYNGIFRNTFVINKQRKISAIFEGVDPKTHVDEVLEFLKK